LQPTIGFDPFSMRRIHFFFLALLILCTLKPSLAQSWTARWLANVAATQSRQPHWISPLVVTNPTLVQQVRADFVRESLPDGQQSWNYDNGKGLELISASRIELLVNVPPVLQHSQNGVPDGPGDASFLMKYRALSATEGKGDYVVTALFGGSVPTGTYKNGAISSVLTPTLAVGKGWRGLDVQSTLGGTLPVDSVQKLGRTIVWNTVAQQHLGRFLWPEVEANASMFEGGPNDGKKLTFITPGLLLGKFPIHDRVGLAVGAGMQIAASHYHPYNHALIFTVRVPY
jgi:hypothetical protein